MLTYTEIMPLIGQAVARSRSTRLVHYVVERRAFLRRKLMVVDRVQNGDKVIVDCVASGGAAGVTQTALKALGDRPIETQRAVLDFLRALQPPEDARGYEAEELMDTLWNLSCGLSTRELEDRLR